MSTLPNNTINSVVGTDGHTPIENYYSTFHRWDWDEIYWGQEGHNKFIPKVGDEIRRRSPRGEYEVTRVDELTLIPQVVPISYNDQNAEDNDLNYLIGVGPGQQSNFMRVYVDKSVTPHVLAVDKSLWIGGEDAYEAIIFKGSPVFGSIQEPVSLLFDSTNQLIGNKIPLELAERTPGSGELKKTVATANTLHDLQDNEPVTIVFYGQDGHEVSKRLLLVENSAFINASQDPYEVIEDISIESPWLSPGDPTMVEFPLNLTMDSLNLMGVAHLRSGRQIRLPVDGNKFKIAGLEAMVSTIPNHKYPTRLVYTLAPNEISDRLVVHTDRTINKSYTFRTTQEEGMYSVRLYCYPIWVSAAAGYRLRWFMFNLDRKVHYEVPASAITISSTGSPFDPLAYGARQNLHVSVSLRKVDPVYRNVEHAQNFIVTLLGPGTGPGPRWNVQDVGYDPYGGDMMAKMQFVNNNLRYLSLAGTATNREDWIAKTYYLANPLYDRNSETKAPAPDRFWIKTDSSVEMEVSVNDWNAKIPVNFQIQANDTLFLRFAKRTPSNTLQLAMGAMHIEQVPNL